MDPVVKLKKEFKLVDAEVDLAYNQMAVAKKQMRAFHKKFHETLQVKYRVYIPADEFKSFVESPDSVMMIEDGKVRMFESESDIEDEDEELLKNAVKIYGREWYAEGCEFWDE